MASWNGSSIEGNQSNSGSGLGLPAAFPRSTRHQSRGGNSRQYNVQRNSGYQNSPVSLANENLPAVDNVPRTSERIYTLTDSELAIAASSNLTPTAGEFVPRSQLSQIQKKKPVPVQKAQETRPTKTVYQNGPQNKRQDTRYSQPGRSQEFSNRRGFDSNQRSYCVEDSKTHDRERLLSEAAAFLTSMSNPEAAHISVESSTGNSSSNTVRETQRDVSGDTGSRYRNNGNYQGNRDGSSNIHSSRNQQQMKYDNAYRRRTPEPYNKGYQSQGGNNWRGNVKGTVYSTETFTGTNSRSAQQSRQGNGYSSNHSSPRREQRDTFHSNKDDDASQRERLIDQLGRGTLECLVCCDRIRQQEAVWSCTQCFHVLHLRCVKKWAFTSKADNGWRCPACQFVTAKVPSEYYCFCGQVRDPEYDRQEVAHSCGEVCNKSRASRIESAHCIHRCTLLCHPGPCPICTAQVKRECGCGATSQIVKCGGDAVLLCEGVCGKKLNCGQHACEMTCHMGDCDLCQKPVVQVCHCGASSRELVCTVDTARVTAFECEGRCDKTLACGNHACERQCHPGACDACALTPDAIKTCPCGKQVLRDARKSCLDEVPTCGAMCCKKLACGQPSSPHECQVVCHSGACPDCPLSTLVRCRCGNMDREIPCTELTTKADDARCSKKCAKKRACGKHKCNQMCCIDLDHVCPLVCNHQLSCGRHKCELLCHRGHCKPCHRVGWEELFCECGKTVTLPPIPCGTRPPECTNPCSRAHICDHPPQHNCHSYPQCPPCTIFTSKYCYGKHLLRKNVPCYLTEISCGLACDKALPCGRHKCILPCHMGVCLKPGARCVQACTTPRVLCGHVCNAPCHDANCPDTPCKEMVKVTCECGNRSVSRACADNAKEYQRIATSLLASKMADMQLGHTVDIADLAGSRKMSLKTLDCNEECKVLERNRRLAIGLQIVNPDLSAKLTPRYSEFMRGWAKKDPSFCKMIHTKLTELVQLAKQSKQKSRSYSFEPMNRDKRHFVHECCEHFGCQSEAYDPEPKRNVVATAVRDKVWLPSMSLMEVIQRENGVRKIPKPVINFTSSTTTIVTGTAPNTAWRSIPAPVVTPSVAAPTSTPVSGALEPIDYFDFTS